jgi:5-methylcytosine-specific restriction endonuclease McrA
MRELALPKSTIEEALDACIGTIQNLRRRTEFNVARAALTLTDRTMRNTLMAGQHSQLNHSQYAAPQPLTTDDMTWLYKQRMVDSSDGRRVYNRIKLAAGECPLCSQRDVQTLDHYFPKAMWPALAVSPANLVPACLQCNATKNATAVSGLHPYYDRLGTDRWLIAAPCTSGRMTVSYHIDPPVSWSTDLVRRMSDHFRVLKLNELYQFHAGSEMRRHRRRLARIKDAKGIGEVRDYLVEEAETQLADHRNGWRGALYEMLASTPAYYNGAFAHVG